jgi:hypothetical protein
MTLLMTTWTDVFEATGSFFYWIFKCMRALGQSPNVIMGSIVIFLLAYWCVKIVQQNKKAAENGTYK